MIRQVVSRLPPSFLRGVGRVQFRIPLLRWVILKAGDALSAGTGTIRHGVGAGLRFDGTGGQPGYLLGTSEALEQELLAKHLAPGDVFYDIGANIGFFSTIAARLVGPAGQVYAFEPYPASATTAARNGEINGFVNLDVLPVAVSDTDGRLNLALSTAGSTTHRLAEGPGIEVDVVALDRWISRENARPPTLVMIDVEGDERNVLSGMRAVLEAHRPVVCCEVHWLGKTFLDYFHAELAPLGYVIANLDGSAVRVGADRWHAVLSPA